MATDRDTLAREIDRLRRRHAHLLAECREAPSLWDLVGHTLEWRVFLDDVAEPDFDVEVLHEVIVVRGTLDRGEHPHRQALLPLPAPYAEQCLRMRFVSGVLEIRIEGPR